MSGSGEQDRIVEINAIVEKFVGAYSHFREKGTFKSARESRNYLLELQKFTKTVRKEIQDRVNEKHGHAVNLTDEEVPVVDGSTSGEATPVTTATKTKAARTKKSLGEPAPTPVPTPAPVPEPAASEPKKKPSARSTHKKAEAPVPTPAPTPKAESSGKTSRATPKKKAT